MRTLTEGRELKDLCQKRNPVPSSNVGFGYIRISPSDVPSLKYSLDSQKSKLEAWATLHDIVIKRVFVDTCTIDIPHEKRPALTELLKEIFPGETLITLNLNRIIGSTADYLHVYGESDRRQFRFATVQSEIDTGTPMGKFAALMTAAAFELLEDILDEQREERNAAPSFLSDAENPITLHL